MSNVSKRILSLLVVAVMVFSMIPATVFAADAQTESQQTVTTPAQQDAPDATVSVLKPLTLTQTEHGYRCWPSGDATIDRPLQIVMNFKANETLEECVAGKFSKYLVDFYLQVDGLANGTIMTDGCYLAGNYGSFGWIVIPADGIEMEEGVSYPIVSAYDATLNYKDICGSVKDFTAAIYISDKILEENPNFEVTLELRMTNPDDRSEVIVVGTPVTYTVADLQAGMAYLNKYDDVATEHVEKIEQVNTNTTIDTQEHAEVIEATKEYMLERFPDLTEEQVAAAVTEVVITFRNMDYEEDKAPKKITYSVSPVVKAGTFEQKITTFDEPVTFRLPVSNAETNTKANVYHEDELMGVYPIQNENGVKFVEVSSKNFSNFTVEPTDGYVAAIGEDKFETLQDAVTALQTNGGTLTLLADATINTSIVILKNTVINGNGHKLTVNGAYGIDVKAGVELEINDLTLESNSYAINFRGASDNAKAEINNSYIKGYGALNIWGSDVIVDVNNSTLHGHNHVSGAANGFSVITLNARYSLGEVSNGTKVNVNGGKIVATRDDGCEFMAIGRVDSITGEINISSETVIENNAGGEVQIQYSAASHGAAISATLQDAIDNAAPGETVILLRDIEVTEPVVIPVGKTVVLDLNGKTLTGEPTEAKAFEVIKNNGNLTVTGNGKIVCDHKLAGSTGYAINTITNCGTLVIENGVIENKSTAAYQIGYAIDNNSTSYNATLTIKGGEVKASGSYYYDAIRLFCNSMTAENTVTVTGGKVSTIWLQNPSDGATEKDAKDVKGTVIIEGGEVGGLYLEPSSAFNAAVTDGQIGQIEYFTSSEGRDLTGFVSGGTFGSDVSDFVADGFQSVDNGNGTYGVEVDPAYGKVAMVGGTYYATLQDAVTALRANGGTLTLLADANESITLNYPADGAPVELTIDLNGFTITSAKSTLWVSDGYKVTIKDSKGTGKIISTNADGEAIAITRNGHVILESGYVYNDYCAVWMYGATENGTFVMNGGTLEVPNGGQTLSVGAGKATINGGKILCNKIPGGGGWNTLVYANGALEITGGEFLGTIGTYGGPVSISGGTFSYCDDPNDGFRDEHLVEGYATKVNADGSFTVYALPTSLSGSGTQEDPYLINNLDDLKLFRSNVNNGNRYNGQFVKLNADIDLNDEEWTPIGDRNADQGSFLGTFDGGNHTISNLWISKWNKTGAGFFSKIGLQSEHVTGTVKNVTFNNVTIISSQSYVGVIAQAPSGALIENVHITGEVNISGYGYVGGIVGHGYAMINDCSVKAYGKITANYWGAGAILGLAGDNGARINNATVAGVDDPSTDEEETITIHASQGGAATVAGGAYGAAIKDANVSNADVTSNSDLCMGYVTAGGTLQGEIVVENVTSTANGVAVAPDEVAKIGDVIYTELADAIGAAGNGETVTLLVDIEVTEPVVIPVGKTVVLNLNGKTLTGAATSSDRHIYVIHNCGTLTIKGNGTITGRGIYNGYDGENVYATAVMTIEEGVNIYAVDTNGGYAVGNYATLTINGGTIKAWEDDPSDPAISGNYDATAVYNKGTATINGGTIISTTNFTYAVTTSGTLTVNGGYIKGRGGISVSAGTATINGGTICNDIDNASTGHAVYISSGKVIITNGAFTATNDVNDGNTTVYVENGAVAEISGGTFTTNNYTKAPYGKENGTITISGGTFDKAIAEKYCAEGFKPVDNGDGTYGVEVDPAYGKVAMVGGNYYDTLQDAINAAKSGETVVLLADLEQNPVVLPAGVKLDLNGMTIKGNLVGTIVMNGGTWITPEDYKMAGPDADYYKTSDAVIVTDANGNITIAAGTMELAHADWWTGEGQVLTVGADATFIIPAGKNLNVRSTVVIEGTLVVEGTVNLYETYSTIKSANAIENVVTTVKNAKVTYRNGAYSVVKFDEVNSLSTSLKGNIGFKMYFALSEKALADTDAYVVFKIDGEEIARQYIRDAGSPDSDGDYVFECAVAAAQMTKKVSVQIVYGDGTVGAEHAYSVRDYALKRINNEKAPAEVKALLRAMLNYGAYAQLHFGYNTGDLANTDVNDLPSIEGVTAGSITQSNVQSGAATGIAINGYSTLLESETTFKFAFTLESGYSITDFTFSYVDAEGETIIMTPKQDADGSYCVYIEDIPAALLDQMYTITVKNNNDATSYSLTTCVLCYAKSVMNNSNNTEAKVNMAKALYLYSQAANTYFGQ